MRLVCDQQVERRVFRRGQNLGALDQIDRGNHHGMDGPRIDAGRELRSAALDRLVVEYDRDDAEPMAQLERPRVTQSRGTQDQGAIDQAAHLQLGQDQAGLNRLAQADRISQQHARGATEDRQCWFQLIRDEIQGGTSGAPQAERRPLVGDGGECRPKDGPPLSPPRPVGVGWHDAFERRDRLTAPTGVTGPSSLQRQDRTLVEGLGSRDGPALVTNHHDVTGLHACHTANHRPGDISAFRTGSRAGRFDDDADSATRGRVAHRSFCVIATYEGR